MTAAYRSPWGRGWRERVVAGLGGPWDLVVVGGGITGAGILALAVRAGHRVLLVDRGDFGSGTSCRSSKLVHGGLRYLKRGRLALTRKSVHERQALLREAAGLVRPLEFLYAVYRGDPTAPWLVGLGLALYTRLAGGGERYERLAPARAAALEPGLRREGLVAGFRYQDAETDDARLVLRVLHDGLLAGGGRASALSYARVTGLLRSGGRVTGVAVRDEIGGGEREVAAGVVVNATGIWADGLRAEVGGPPRLRPLRGSHLYFDAARLPLARSIAFAHPADGRPVFAYPWEGVTLVGTTDVDHGDDLEAEPAISPAESGYLLDGVRQLFPGLGLGLEDVVSAQAGVRAVVRSGRRDPSAESRDEALWVESGLLTVTGGKLTTFRLVAAEALAKAAALAPALSPPPRETPVFDPAPTSGLLPGLDASGSLRLAGRYGRAAPALVDCAAGDLAPIPGTPYLAGEILWSAENEAVTRLSDLLLRRFRLGVLRRDGGEALLEDLGDRIRDRLGWDAARWEREVAAFRRELAASYRVAGRR